MDSDGKGNFTMPKTRTKREPDGSCGVGEFTLDKKDVGRAEFAQRWGTRYPEHWELVQEMLRLIESSEDGFLYKWVWHEIHYVIHAGIDFEAYSEIEPDEADTFSAATKRQEFQATLRSYYRLLEMIDAARQRQDSELVGLLEFHKREGLFDEGRLRGSYPFLWMLEM
jgi:hypothetical protein